MAEQKIAIMVDSACDLPQEYLDRYHFYLAPLRICFSDGEFRDVLEINSDELFRRMKTELPKTSLPDMGEIMATIEQIKAEGYTHLLVVTLSSNLSGTWNMMTMLSKSVEGLTMYALDSKNISIGSGFHAIMAAEYIRQGMDWDTLIAKLEAEVHKSHVYFTLDTLEYLQKGGRIGLVTATLGSVFNIKPVIYCNLDGIYETIAKTRGRKASIEKLLDTAVEYGKNSNRYNIALVGTGDSGYEAALTIKEELLERLPHVKEFIVTKLGCTCCVHTGEGMVGIAVQILD